MFDSILVVCTGNICRSPIGERLLRQQLPGKRITSAGVFGLEGHRARKLTQQLMRESDLILVMEPAHLRFISAMAPELRGKSLLFGQWLEPQEIPDPYRKSREAFDYVFGLLGKASQEWAHRLSQKGMKH